MISVSTRQPTPEERAWWSEYHRVSLRDAAEGAAWFMLPVMGGFGVGAVVEWITENAGARIAPYPSLVAAGLGLCLSTVGLWWVRRNNRVPKGPPVVELVHIADPVLVEAEQMVSEGPLYFLGVGEDTILFLHGQWMHDPHVYADPELDPDRFPNSEFRLVREPETGVVLRVEVLGNPIRPNRVLKRGSLAIPPLANGSRFKGSLEQLQDALYDADEDHVLRRPRRKRGS